MGFYIKAESERKFELLNGPSGAWSKFFTRSSDFCGTNYLKSLESVLKDEEQARRYLTMDRWRSKEGFDSYVAEHQDRFDELSGMNEELALAKNHFGFFELSGGI